MSELINNSNRKALLKHMILQLHEGEAPDQVKNRLVELLKKVPYNEVVEVEQELINEGLPVEDVLKLCDIHTYVLESSVDASGQPEIPAGHPVDTFKKENLALDLVVKSLNKAYDEALDLENDLPAFINKLRSFFNQLMDVDKHYRRKENLLFPYLEKHGISGPPKVMWGKHDETRAFLKAANDALRETTMNKEEMLTIIELLLKPASKAITDMIMKEEEILLPMSLETIRLSEWYEIYHQTPEIGFCLYDPKVEWQPLGEEGEKIEAMQVNGKISLPSGSFTTQELMAVLNTLPIDITFVDRNDKVAYFSQGKERIFDRNRAILQRDVRMCHPPHSVHTVEQIINDFRSGKESRAPFWIQMGDKFVHIEYFALRDDKGEYLGTVEVSQELSGKRKLQGEQRLLSYEK
ncbi:MAG: DUF438 domain-containing protein [Bacteroidales bacterium]|nr:DUF438 domain-containing protein [Bacteroidales bacterium]